jgi:cytochrome c oxidase cbb3-type subunit 3
MSFKFASFVVLVAGVAIAQQETPAAAGAPTTSSQPRRSRGDTREFLGLGRAPDAAAAARGEKLYAPNCAFCHGARAAGGEGPDLVRSALVLHDDKGELVGSVVHNGRADRGMPPFPAFTDSQLADLAEFLHMRVELVATRGLYQIQNIVTGDARAGEAYFNGAGKCASCHSASGDLAHVGTRFQSADLQQAFLYPGARGFKPGRPTGAIRVTVKLPSGQLWKGTLKRMDDFSVSLYDAEGNFHSFSLENGTSVDVEDKLAPHRELLDHYTDTEMHNLTAYLATLK